VKQMGNTAGHAAEKVMDSSFAQTVKANPIPSAMIGIGTAWLLMKGRSNTETARRRDYSRYRTGQSYGTSAYGTGEGAYGAADSQSGSYQGGSDIGSGAYGGDTRDWRATTAVGTTGYNDYASGVTGESARVPEFGGEMRGYDRRYGQNRGFSSSFSLERTLRENPLVVGAAAALVGVAIGMSVPSSETENRLMGEARDNVVDRARGLASEAAEKVQDVAGQAANAATQVRDAATRAVGSSQENNPSTSGSSGSASAGESGLGSENTGIGGTTASGSTRGRSGTRRNTSS